MRNHTSSGKGHSQIGMLTVHFRSLTMMRPLLPLLLAAAALAAAAVVAEVPVVLPGQPSDLGDRFVTSVDADNFRSLIGGGRPVVLLVHDGSGSGRERRAFEAVARRDSGGQTVFAQLTATREHGPVLDALGVSDYPRALWFAAGSRTPSRQAGPSALATSPVTVLDRFVMSGFSNPVGRLRHRYEAITPDQD